MDITIKNLQRLALKYNNNQHWRPYVRALERRLNGADEDNKLFAVIYQRGSDTPYSILGTIPYEESDDKESLLEKLRQQHYSHLKEHEFADYCASEVRGAWVVNEDTLELTLILEEADPGYDTGYYAWTDVVTGFYQEYQIDTIDFDEIE